MGHKNSTTAAPAKKKIPNKPVITTPRVLTDRNRICSFGSRAILIQLAGTQSALTVMTDQGILQMLM